MLFLVALLLCGPADDRRRDPFAMALKEGSQYFWTLSADLARFDREKNDAAWLEAWGRLFPLCRRFAWHAQLAPLIDPAERRARAAAKPDAGLAMAVVWARAFVTCQTKKTAELRRLIPEFEAALRKAGVSSGEAAGDLEYFRAAVADADKDDKARAAASRKACDAYRAAGRTAQQPFLWCVQWVAKDDARADPNGAVARWKEFVDAAERVHRDEPMGRASTLRFAYDNLMTLSARTFRHAQAVYYADRLLDLLEEAEPDPTKRLDRAAHVLNCRGISLHELGDNSEAVDCYLRALLAFQSPKAPRASRDRNVAMVINNLGNSLRDLGRFAESEGAYREACRLAEEADPADRATLHRHYTNWGRSLLKAGKLKESEEAFVKAEEHAKAGGPSVNPIIAVDRGERCLLEGDLTGAMKRLIPFLRAPPPRGNIAFMNDFPRVVGQIDQLRGKRPLAQYQARLQYQVGKARDLAPTLAEVRLLEYANRPEAPSPVYLLSVLRPGVPEDDQAAYDAVWRARGVAASTLMQRRRASGPKVDGLRRQLDEQRQRLSAAVNAADVDLETARNIDDEALEKEALEEEWAIAVADEQKVVWRNPDELAKHLAGEVALVEYLRVRIPRPPKDKKGPWPVDDVYEAYVVRADEAGKLTAVRRSLGPSAAIDAAALAFRNAIAPTWAVGRAGGRAVEAAKDGGAELRRLVVDPIAADLAGRKTVLIAPDGLLHQVPWCALPGKAPKTYWGDEVALVAASSGPALLETLASPPAPARKSALLVGGVTFQKAGGLLDLLFGPSSGIAPLPATAEVVDDLAKMLRAWDVDLQTGERPDERALREALPRHRWVHLTTHGFFSNRVASGGSGGLFADDPAARTARATLAARHPLLFSGLVLAKAGETKVSFRNGRPPLDNLLTADEISGLRLENTELVVLAACGSAHGVIEYGDGSASLSRAFHLAGVRSVVASRWPITVGASAHFSRRFYANLLAGQSRAAALADAQRWLRTEHREWSAPEHWASYVLSGDWR